MKYKGMSGSTISEIISSKAFVDRQELLELNKLNTKQKNEMKKCGTLCWKCTNAAHSGCSWIKKDRPVKGWIAEPTFSVGCGRSYMVYDCPKYTPFSLDRKTPYSYDVKLKGNRKKMRNAITSI